MQIADALSLRDFLAKNKASILVLGHLLETTASNTYLHGDYQIIFLYTGRALWLEEFDAGQRADYIFFMERKSSSCIYINWDKLLEIPDVYSHRSRNKHDNADTFKKDCSIWHAETRVKSSPSYD